MPTFRLIVFATSVLALSACAHQPPPPSTAIMPAGALGTNGDIDVRALNVVAYDFGRRIRNNPGDVAEAVAALDYLGGELNTNPRWVGGMQPLARLQMLQARQTIRGYIGISQDAPSQAVVDTMLALAQAYRGGDEAAVQRLLASPIFVDPPAEVQAHLYDLPLMPAINNVTTRAASVFPAFAPGS